MQKEIRLFKSEEDKSRAEAAVFLRQIAEKLESGQVILKQGAQELALDIPMNLILEVQVENEDKKSRGMQDSIEIEFKWFDGEEGGGPLQLG